MAIKKYVGDAAIRKGIKALDKVMGNVNDRVQDLAVSIIVHAAGPGNGDVSRALDLCKVVKRHRTMNVAFLVGFFRYFGNCNVNLNANNGAGKVSLVSKDAKGYRGFDPQGAEHHRWDEAFKDDGTRSDWYAGPAPAEYQPQTIGDLAADLNRFVEREMKKLTDTKTVNGKEVPIVQLTEGDREQFTNAMELLNRISATLARHEDLAKAKAAVADAEQLIEADAEVVELIQPKEKAVA